jgi:hypothetical protein
MTCINSAKSPSEWPGCAQALEVAASSSPALAIFVADMSFSEMVDFPEV